MILIADGGSTKTEWCLLDVKTQFPFVQTSGINPFYQNTEDIINLLNKELVLKIEYPFSTVFFYGAGCANSEKNSIVYNAISQVFKIENIFIASDLVGAARSLCQNEKGIVSILGTGSNSCYYDGNEITANVSPLGFILGDEGSGAVIGRKLLGNILKKQLPDEIISLFYETYKISPTEIMDSINRKPFPNRFLAGFARFISQNIHFSQLESIILESFKEFFQRNLLQYKEVKEIPLNFTGSIAYHFRDQLLKTILHFDLKPGKIVQAPLAGLIEYHINFKK